MSEARLYRELAGWWPLLSPAEHYAEEAALHLSLLTHARGGPPRSLLELGCGCGPLAANMPADLDLTLVDASAEMLAVSQASNPDRVHVCADMRELSLGRQFDAILLHDAVMYLTDRDSLRRTFAVMFAHCAPGGAVLVIPDAVQETFEELATSGGWGEAAGGRAVQLLEWHWDPDPDDDTYQVEFSLLLREHGRVQSVHEQHTMGLYPRALFWALLVEAGFEPVAAEVLFDAPMGEVFLARRPLTAR